MSDNPFALSNIQQDSTPPANDNPFSLAAIERDQGQDLRNKLRSAVTVNPDQAAEADRLAKRYPVPQDVLARNLMDVKLQAAVDEADERLRTSPKLAQALREKPWLAQQAHDDFPPLTQIEQTIAKRADRTVMGTAGDIGVTALKGAVGLPQAFVGLADLVSAGYAGKGLEAIGLRFEDAQKILDGMYSPAQQQSNEAVREAEGFVSTLGAMLSNPSTIATTVGQSAPQMLGGAAIGKTIISAAPKIAPWLAAALGEGIMGAGSAAEQTRAQTDDGLLSAKQVFASVASGAGTALFGAVGGRAAQRLGLGDIDTALVARGVDQASAKTLQAGFIASMAKAGISEGVFEELPQSVQEQIWSNWATDKPLGQGVGAAAAQGLLAGLAMGGGFQAVTDGAARVEALLAKREQQTAAAEALGDTLQTAMQAASASALRTRNPETFNQLIQYMAESNDGQAPTSIYIDAAVLAQSGVNVAEMLPSVADQMDAALASNGSVEVAISDVLTAAPGTPLEDVFLQNARGTPDGLSLAEAKQAGQQADQWKAEAERVMTEAQDQAAWSTSAETVKTTILDQLNTAGRFTPDVNEAYATLVRDFYSVTASRAGMTPDQMYARYPLRVGAQGQTAGTLDQSFADDPARWPALTAARATMPAPIATTDGEGVTYEYHAADNANPYSTPQVLAVMDGRVVGSLGVTDRGENLVGVVQVQKESRRKGVASAMYAFAEQQTGKRFVPEAKQTPDSAALWANPNRAFGQQSFNQAAPFDGPETGNTPIGDATTVEVDGKMRPALNSNGQPIAATQEGVRNFWRWFGDSRVVDADGKPLVVYHGTTKDFDAFDQDSVGDNFGRDNDGFFFTGSAVEASGYADPQSELLAAGRPDARRMTPLAQANVMPVYLSIKNPLALERYTWAIASSPEVEIDESGVSLIDFFDSGNGDVTRYAKEKGHDGVLFQRGGETLAVAFFPEQIKSATGNRGTFDGQDANILRQDQRDLMVTHNLTADNLLHAAKMGGIAVPSLAVTRKDNPLTGFGEITLIGPPEMADPKGYASTKVFGADIYSPRYPSVERELDKKGVTALVKKIQPMTDKLGARQIDTQELERNGQRELERNIAVMATFLKEQGVEPNVVMRTGMDDARRARLEQFGMGPFMDTTNLYDLLDNPDFVKAAVAETRDAYASLGKRDSLVSKLDTDEDFQHSIARDVAYKIVEDAKLRKKPEADSYQTQTAMEKQIADANLANAYQQFVADTLTSVTKSERIFQGFTNSGNRKYIPHTLENVVKLLKKELRGGEGVSYGVGSVRAKYTPQFKSVAEIRKNKDRLISAADFEKVKQEIDTDFNALLEMLRTPDNGSVRSETLVGILEDAPRMGLTRAAKDYAVEMTPEAQQAAVAFMEKLRTLPTAYFEAKILREVSLSEFKAAVVPEGVNPKAVEALRAAGVTDIRTYAKSDEADRAAKIGEFNDLFFQQARGTFNPSQLLITLNENADLSTFLHESGHFFLEVMADLASQPNAPAGVVEDMAATLKWFGIKGNENVGGADSGAPLEQAAAQGYEGSDAGEAAEWLAAVAKGLDMSLEARMARAEAMGFDTSKKLYHSTLADTKEFAPFGKFMGFTGTSGISVTDSPEMASRYLDRYAEFGWVDGKPNQAFQKNVIPVFIKPGKVLERNEPFPMPPGMRLGAPLPPGYVPAHKQMGYDTLVRDDAISRKGPVKHSDAKNAIRGKEYVLTDPSQLRSIFAAFDPDNAASGNLLAQGGNAPTDNTQPAGRTPLEVWNVMTLDQKRPYHERWAESFEQYLLEGKAPSAELQPLFRRFRSWLVNVYKSLTHFMRGRDLKVNDEIRQVFDRLVATDEQIAQAEETAGMLPDFDATNEAIEKLTARSLRDLKWAVNARNKKIRELQKQAAALRKDVETEVTAEVNAMPEVRAKEAIDDLRKSTPEYKAALAEWKAQRQAAVDQATTDITTNLLATEGAGLEGLKKGQFLAKNKRRIANEAEGRALDWERQNPKPERTLVGGEADLAMVADQTGYSSVEDMLAAIDAFGRKADVIKGLTDQRMLERHGDLVDQRAIEDAATEAVHNDARARALATELKAQADALNPREQTGTSSNGRPVTVNALERAAKEFAKNLAARRRIKDLKAAAAQHRAAEARAGKAWQKATTEGKTQEAVQAKRDQLLNNQAVRALQEAQAEAKKIVEFFRKVTDGSNEKTVERGRDPDVVNAMRAILASYDVAPRLEKGALEYMETVARNDPAMHAALAPSVQAALNNAKPLSEMSMEELRGLNDELRAMWDLAKRSRQMEVDGNLLDIEEAADQLVTRMGEIGIPDEIPGERQAISDAEERGIKLQFAKAILSRVEQWAERVDGAFGGPFLRLVFQPIKDAADRYRADRVRYRKQFTKLLEGIAPALPPGPVAAPELGYTFGAARDSGTAELLHAILHTGNDSNKRKLLLGRGWATENADGTLDTAKWDAFMERMHAEGKITKAHYDFAQGVWDLLEQMKPLAQETHRNVFGRYFAEVTANEVVTPFGTYRGGYVPAQTDSRLVTEAKIRELAEGENESMAYAFPSSPSGFTKSRVEYNKPLLLDIRALAQHMDKVLLFSHMQGAVTDVRRLLSSKNVSYALDRVQPGAYEGMLIPWLNRAARQVVETPVMGDRKISRFLSGARSRAGMAMMFANLSNTAQQITGFSLAAVKVKPGLLLKAAAQAIANPLAMRKNVADTSVYMKDRMLNETAAMSDAVEDILVNPSVYEKAQTWTQRHAYFMQSAVDNFMSPIVWTGAYNQAVEQGESHEDAVRFADGTVRQTQGSTLPEDISRFESGPAYARLFTQFVGYFNMMANTNTTAMSQIVGEMGLKKGAGKLVYVALAGLLVPIWVAEAIAQAFRGGPEDDDGDGYLDDWLAAVFGLGTMKGLLAQVPFAGQAGQLVLNRFNDNPADDKFSLSPAVSLIESAVSSPSSVYKAVVDEGNAQKAVRDVAAAATLATGLPFYAAARPIGYMAGVAQGKIQPTSGVDVVRGTVTGAVSPESRTP